MRLSYPALLCSAALLAPHAAAQSLLVVDAGPGGAFDTIQLAVDAAVNGDRILVKDGAYPGFTITSKRLDLLAQNPGQVQLTSQTQVTGLAANQPVTLFGFHSSPSETPLLLNNSAGLIVLEQCSLFGSGIPIFQTNNGLQVTGCDQVVITDCHIESADLFTASLSGGGTALVVEASTVVAFDSVFDGGTQLEGIQGSPGVYLNSGELRAMGCEIVGGLGGFGPTPTTPFIPCNDGAQGGPAVLMAQSPFVGGPAILRTFGCTLVPGAGGLPSGTPCLEGAPGVLLESDPTADFDIEPGTPRRYSVTSPIVRGQVGDIEFEGEPGEFVFWIFSQQFFLADFPLDAALGSLIVQPNFNLKLVGSLPASGQLTVSGVIDPPAAGPALIAREQGLFFDPLTLDFRLGSYTNGWILDAGL